MVLGISEDGACMGMLARCVLMTPRGERRIEEREEGKCRKKILTGLWDVLLQAAIHIHLVFDGRHLLHLLREICILN